MSLAWIPLIPWKCALSHQYSHNIEATVNPCIWCVSSHREPFILSELGSFHHPSFCFRKLTKFRVLFHMNSSSQDESCCAVGFTVASSWWLKSVDQLSLKLTLFRYGFPFSSWRITSLCTYLATIWGCGIAECGQFFKSGCMRTFGFMQFSPLY